MKKKKTEHLKTSTITKTNRHEKTTFSLCALALLANCLLPTNHCFSQMVVDTFSFTPLDNSIQQQCEGSIATIQRVEPDRGPEYSGCPRMLIQFLYH